MMGRQGENASAGAKGGETAPVGAVRPGGRSSAERLTLSVFGSEVFVGLFALPAVSVILSLAIGLQSAEPPRRFAASPPPARRPAPPEVATGLDALAPAPLADASPAEPATPENGPAPPAPAPVAMAALGALASPAADAAPLHPEAAADLFAAAYTRSGRSPAGPGPLAPNAPSPNAPILEAAPSRAMAELPAAAPPLAFAPAPAHDPPPAPPPRIALDRAPDPSPPVLSPSVLNATPEAPAMSLDLSAADAARLLDAATRAPDPLRMAARGEAAGPQALTALGPVEEVGGAVGSAAAPVVGLIDVLLYYGPGTSEARARRLAEGLSALGYRRVETRRVMFRIRESAVRYFFDADRAAAGRLRQDALETRLTMAETMAGQPQDFTRYRPSPEPGAVALWLAE